MSEFEKLELTKRSLTLLGFTEEEAEKQINEVGKLITMAIFQRLLKERSSQTDLTPENVKNYLKQNFTAQYVKEVIEIESVKIVEEYLKVVTQDVSPEQKEKFLAQIK